LQATVAIIPARGGSKGVAGKNLQLVGGLPLVARTIRAASAAKLVDRVIVSTDCQRISSTALEAGAQVILRPPDISGDTATSESALLHALDTLELQGLQPDTVVFLQCTSPFTSPQDIDLVVDSLKNSEANVAFSVCRDHSFLWSVDEDGLARGINHDSTHPRQRRQDISPQFRETGAIYAMRTKPFRERGSRFCGPALAICVSSPSIEIDTLQDLELARALATKTDPVANRSPVGLRALVMDFDGVHTDDTVWVTEDGKESVRCSRADGLGLEKLRKAGLRLLVLSKERNPVVAARAKKLQIDVLQCVEDKLTALEKWLREHGFAATETAFIGNDINDLDCMRAAGWSATPADAHPEARAAASYVCGNKGGRGALREVADLILRVI
jgi:YrbI family 3-deoxy-D-manno-octulosonate 8-phosphate phosphatase